MTNGRPPNAQVCCCGEILFGFCAFDTPRVASDGFVVWGGGHGRRVRWRWEELSIGFVSAFVGGGAGDADMEEADWVDERTGAEKEC